MAWIALGRINGGALGIASATINYSSWLADTLYIAAICTDSTGASPNMDFSLNNGAPVTNVKVGNSTNDVHCGMFFFTGDSALSATSMTYTRGTGTNWTYTLYRLASDVGVAPPAESVLDTHTVNGGASQSTLVIKDYTTNDKLMDGSNVGIVFAGAKTADSGCRVYEGISSNEDLKAPFGGGATGVSSDLGFKYFPIAPWNAYASTSGVSTGMSGISAIVSDVSLGPSFERDGVPGEDIAEVDGVQAADIAEVDGVVAMTRMLPSGLLISNDPKYMRKAA